MTSEQIQILGALKTNDNAPETVSGIPEVMDEAEVYAILNISPATARRYRRRGELGFCRYGVRIKYLGRHIVEIPGRP